MKIAKSVQKLEAYTPGEQPKSKKVVKLNTNENPYPPSPTCEKVLAHFDLEKLRKYPDPNFTVLREALAKLNKTTIENIFVGNGSDEVLSVAARAFVEDNEAIGSLDPSYSLYKTLAAIRTVKWAGVDVRQRNKDISTQVAQLKEKVSLFLWTNPNAPTGELAEPAEIAAFAAKFPGVVIIDEAYADFARVNCMNLATAAGNTNVLVMRTFSKSYSLAGLRVGYCVGPKDLIEAMYKVKDSYNVDAVAQAVALAAIKDQAWMRRNVEKVIRTRARLTSELTRRGWDVLPSESNFLFAQPPTKGDVQAEAARIFNALRDRSIFVRYFPGKKTGSRLRITVGTDAQVRKLLSTLDEISNAAK